MRSTRSSIGLAFTADAFRAVAASSKRTSADDLLAIEPLSGEPLPEAKRQAPKVNKYTPHIGKKQMEKAAKRAAKQGLKP